MCGYPFPSEQRHERKCVEADRWGRRLGSPFTRRGELKLHAFVRRHETEGLIEPLGLGTLLVRGQLNEVTASITSPLDCPREQPSPEPRTAKRTSNPDALDGGPPTALMGDVRRERKLKDCNRCAISAVDNDQLVVRILRDSLEGLEI
jgi:hypothetical protein